MSLTLTIQKEFQSAEEFATAMISASSEGYQVVDLGMDGRSTAKKAHPNQITGQKQSWEEAAHYAEKWGCSKRIARSRITQLRKENQQLPDTWSK